MAVGVNCPHCEQEIGTVRVERERGRYATGFWWEWKDETPCECPEAQDQAARDGWAASEAEHYLDASERGEDW